MESKKTMRWFQRKNAVILMLILGILLCVSLNVDWAYAEETQRNLKNGSFEEEQSWTGSYKTQNQNAIPYWNTTATDQMIELFRQNTGIYISGVTLTPSDEEYGAELNANEESTLYQVVKTYDSSIYKWGLDHGARNGTDIMALIIGPNQTVAPAKPSKGGRDQFMQMTDWLVAQGIIPDYTATDIDTIGIQQIGPEGAKKSVITVYSKKFGTNGTFEDNADNCAFSLTPSTVYTEEWKIWLIASKKTTLTTGTNPWTKLGANADGEAGGSG